MSNIDTNIFKLHYVEVLNFSTLMINLDNKCVFQRNIMLEKTIGEALGEGILQHLTSTKIDVFKELFNLQKIKNADKEYFYLLMFLATLSCQIVFKDKRLQRAILDNFHKTVFENLPQELKKIQGIKEETTKRYKQYYDLLKTKESNVDITFLISQLPYDFFGNVLNKDIYFIFNDEKFRKEFGKSTVELSIWIGEMINMFTMILQEVKNEL